jgi:hypothetical protein
VRGQGCCSSGASFALPQKAVQPRYRPNLQILPFYPDVVWCRQVLDSLSVFNYFKHSSGKATATPSTLSNFEIFF